MYRLPASGTFRVWAAGRLILPSTRKAATPPPPPFSAVCAVAVVAAPRSGAIASTRRIDVPRAGLPQVSNGFPAHLANTVLLLLPAPRRVAARIAMSIWIFFPRAGLRKFGGRQANSRSRRIQQRVFQLICKAFVVVLDVAPRSGAIPLTRRIAVRRAGTWDFTIYGNFFLTSIQISSLRGLGNAALMPHNETSIFLRPPSDASSLYSYNFSSAARPLPSPPTLQIEIRFSCVRRVTLPRNFVPAARPPASSSTTTLRLVNSRFRVPASEPSGSMVFRYFCFPLRGAQLLKLFNSRASNLAIKSPRTKKFSALRGSLRAYSTISTVFFKLVNSPPNYNFLPLRGAVDNYEFWNISSFSGL
ncbi:hypothetical protein R3P38DRAFT_2795645 [Favolaschia claudopus]|uniref:Uncharacterized protein n=1 Tax=Favolaschia claudopus TaxID=2862362 RepID=A0AAW0A740_9AGAR